MLFRSIHEPGMDGRDVRLPGGDGCAKTQHAAREHGPPCTMLKQVHPAFAHGGGTPPPYGGLLDQKRRRDYAASMPYFSFSTVAAGDAI